MKRTLYFSTDKMYTHLSLIFEPRGREKLWKDCLKQILQRINEEYKFDTTFSEKYKGWITHKSVAKLILEDREWYESIGVELVFSKPFS